MPTRTIDTAEKKTLSDKRKGARMVRAKTQEKINDLVVDYPDGTGREVLNILNEFFVAMIARDKKRKGGLWN